MSSQTVRIYRRIGVRTTPFRGTGIREVAPAEATRFPAMAGSATLSDAPGDTRWNSPHPRDGEQTADSSAQPYAEGLDLPGAEAGPP